MKSMFDRRQSAEIKMFQFMSFGVCLIVACNLSLKLRQIASRCQTFFCISRAAVCCLKCNSFHCTYRSCCLPIHHQRWQTGELNRLSHDSLQIFPMCGIFMILDEWLNKMCELGNILEIVELFSMTILRVIIINWDKRLLTRRFGNCGIGWL